MKILSKILPQLFLTNRPSAVAPANHDALNTPLLWFGKDAWTVRDACEGCLVLGQTGSGKTSGVGQTLAKSFLNAGYGALILCSKKDETELWRQYCRETNRTNSLIIFGPEHPYRFNILNFE